MLEFREMKRNCYFNEIFSINIFLPLNESVYNIPWIKWCYNLRNLWNVFQMDVLSFKLKKVLKKCYMISVIWWMWIFKEKKNYTYKIMKLQLLATKKTLKSFAVFVFFDLVFISDKDFNFTGSKVNYLKSKAYYQRRCAL